MVGAATLVQKSPAIHTIQVMGAPAQLAAHGAAIQATPAAGDTAHHLRVQLDSTTTMEAVILAQTSPATHTIQAMAAPAQLAAHGAAIQATQYVSCFWDV